MKKYKYQYIILIAISIWSSLQAGNMMDHLEDFKEEISYKVHRFIDKIDDDISTDEWIMIIDRRLKYIERDMNDLIDIPYNCIIKKIDKIMSHLSRCIKDFLK